MIETLLEGQLKIGAYNFNFEIEQDYKKFSKYIIKVLDEQFKYFEIVKGIAISLKTFDKSSSDKNYGLLKSEYPERPENDFYTKFRKEIIENIRIKDDAVFFDFYKNASDYGKKTFIVTKDNKEIYNAIENKLNNCKVFDYFTIQSQINKDIELKDFLFYINKNCKKTKTCDSESLNDCIKKKENNECKKDLFELIKKYCFIDDVGSIDISHVEHEKFMRRQSQVLSAFEQHFFAPPNNNWTMISSPYFFLNRFIGTIGVVFEDFESGKIESYVNFLSKAKDSFQRGIINYIADDYFENNKNEKPIFNEFLNHFMDIKEIEEEYLIKILDSHLEEKGKKNGDFIYMPLIRNEKKTEHNMVLPFAFSYNDGTYIEQRETDENKDQSKNHHFKLNREVESTEEEIRLVAFELVTHIQWLWDIWYRKTKNEVNEKTIS